MLIAGLNLQLYYTYYIQRLLRKLFFQILDTSSYENYFINLIPEEDMFTYVKFCCYADSRNINDYIFMHFFLLVTIPVAF